MGNTFLARYQSEKRIYLVHHIMDNDPIELPPPDYVSDLGQYLELYEYNRTTENLVALKLCGIHVPAYKEV